MVQRITLGALTVSLLLVGGAYASAFLPGDPPGWAAWALLLGMSGTLVTLMALGATRHGRLGGLVWPFTFVFAVLVLGFGAVLVLPPADPGDPTLWLGLPPRVAVVLFGVGLLPLLALPVAYAVTFPRAGLGEAEVRAIRDAALRARSDAEGSGRVRDGADGTGPP